jgi:hypothetical protein
VEELTKTCSDPAKVLRILLGTRSAEMLEWREAQLYPQNLLRNMAKKGCLTKFTIVPGTKKSKIENISEH